MTSDKTTVTSPTTITSSAFFRRPATAAVAPQNTWDRSKGLHIRAGAPYHIGKRIADVRNRLGMSLREFAAATGFSYQQIWDWERGGKGMRLASLECLATKLAIMRSELISDDELTAILATRSYAVQIHNGRRLGLIPSSDLGRRIRTARAWSGLSLQDVADIIGTSRQAVHNIEKYSPVVRDIDRLAGALGVSAAFLRGDTDDLRRYPTAKAGA